MVDPVTVAHLLPQRCPEGFQLDLRNVYLPFYGKGISSLLLNMYNFLQCHINTTVRLFQTILSTVGNAGEL